MKKLIVILAMGTLAVSVSAMSKDPAAAKAPADAKACAIKDAACCTTDGSCKMKVSACPACKAASGTCVACKAKADAVKTAEKSGCAGGVCPLTK